jgi:hypothetical protein
VLVAVLLQHVRVNRGDARRQVNRQCAQFVRATSEAQVLLLRALAVS